MGRVCDGGGGGHRLGRMRHCGGQVDGRGVQGTRGWGIHGHAHFKVLGAQRLDCRWSPQGVPLEQANYQLDTLLRGVWNERTETCGHHDRKLEIHGRCKFETLRPSGLVNHNTKINK